MSGSFSGGGIFFIPKVATKVKEDPAIENKEKKKVYLLQTQGKSEAGFRDKTTN